VPHSAGAGGVGEDKKVLRMGRRNGFLKTCSATSPEKGENVGRARGSKKGVGFFRKREGINLPFRRGEAQVGYMILEETGPPMGGRVEFDRHIELRKREFERIKKGGGSCVTWGERTHLIPCSLPKRGDKIIHGLQESERGRFWQEERHWVAISRLQNRTELNLRVKEKASREKFGTEHG